MSGISFCPWKISYLETLIHSIPGVGIFTSWSCLSFQEEKMMNIDEMLDNQTIEILDLKEASDDDELSTDEEFVLFEGIDEPVKEDPLVVEKRLVSAKKANYQALLILNFTCTLGTALALYGIKKLQDF